MLPSNIDGVHWILIQCHLTELVIEVLDSRAHKVQGDRRSKSKYYDSHVLVSLHFSLASKSMLTWFHQARSSLAQTAD